MSRRHCTTPEKKHQSVVVSAMHYIVPQKYEPRFALFAHIKGLVDFGPPGESPRFNTLLGGPSFDGELALLVSARRSSVRGLIERYEMKLWTY